LLGFSARPLLHLTCRYVGANFGGGWTSGSLNIPGNNFYGGITEFIGGVQAGYNAQANYFLFGVEGDFDWTSFDHPRCARHDVQYVPVNRKLRFLTRGRRQLHELPGRCHWRS
jgi:hypothetical protein